MFTANVSFPTFTIYFAAIDVVTFTRCNSDNTYFFVYFFTYSCRTFFCEQIETKLSSKA